MTDSRASIFTVAAFFVAGASGCGVSAPEGLVPASGRVAWTDGKPLESTPGMLRFHPFDPQNPRVEIAKTAEDQDVVARIDSNGRFAAETALVAGGKTHRFKGAPPGAYKVMVFLMPGDNGVPRVNPDYEHPVRTPLMVAIPEAGARDLDLAVDPHLNGWSP
ncbi:hypothetical protein [Botrimarina sp.]|uniref:hypothetical protein n=1 Tax=Botrimarina sp. TaxID=2795802 RepID=UPI0032EDA293